MRGIATAHHHGSHRPLIWQIDESASPVKVDAIIVPTFRRVSFLKQAADAALSLGCPLVTLHSGPSTNAHAAVRSLDPAIDLIAIDLHEGARLRLPELETSRLLAGTMFERRTDVSTKRNLGLALSHMVRWKRVVFLDDDIRVPNPRDLTRAVGLLDTHIAAGLHIGGFPDNSVVCHAFRAGGGRQETFIGGGALAVEVKRNRSFFPNVYNEDWFFVLDAGKGLQPVATAGQVLQDPYDPYRVERAQAEELGDVLAEGTFWLLDQGKPASDGDLDHWRDFLAHRRRFIEQVQDMVECSVGIGAPERARMGAALGAALSRCERITPQLCVNYMKALATDQERWQRHIQVVRRQPQRSRQEALRSLTVSGARPLTWYVRKTSAAREPGASRRRAQPARPAPTWRLVRLGELQRAISAVSATPVRSGFPAPMGVPRGLLAGVPPSQVALVPDPVNALQQRHAGRHAGAGG